MKIAISVTTVSMTKPENDWQSQIRELKKLGIKEVAVFPTGLRERNQRYEFYRYLKEAGVMRIPLFHLMTEMTPEEISFLIESFDIERFNLHSTAEWPLLYDYSAWKQDVFLENGKRVPHEAELDEFGGLCMDYSHWENARLLGDGGYCERMEAQAQRFKIGVSHISAIEEHPIRNPFAPEVWQYDSHLMNDLHELDYLKRYREYLAPINALELENPISDQMRAKEYVERILNS